MKKKFSLKISLGIQEEFSKYKKVVQEFEDVEKKIKGTRSKRHSSKKEKARLESKKKFKA